VPVGAGDADFELAEGDEGVVVPAVEIDVADGGADLAGLAVAVGGRAFEEQAQDVLVVGEQVAAVEVNDLADRLLDLLVIEPVVNSGERLAELGQQDDRVERVAPALGGLLMVHVEREDFPAEALELGEEGVFDVLLLGDVLRFHACHGFTLSCADLAGG
jgi:hypothetical protein